MPFQTNLTKDWMLTIRSFFQTKSKLSYLLLFVAGSLNVFSYSPYGLWPIVIATLALLILSIHTKVNAKQAAKFGFSYGLGWFATGISWVHVAIADFGGLPLFISLALMALLAAYLALFPALAAYISIRFKAQFGFTLFLPAWIFAEWLRSWFLTGFPWLSLGYTQTEGPLSGLAPIIGEIGIQAALVSTSLLLVWCIRAFSKKRSTFVCVAQAFVPIAILFVLGSALQSISWLTGDSKTLNVTLVQGNIEQSLKWQPENEMPTMLKYLEMSQPHFETSDLIIWPEAAVPRLEVIANEYLRDIDSLAAKTDTAIVTGIVDYQTDTGWAFNNLIVLGSKYQDSKYGHYKYLHSNRFSKHHLLPIGEFIPFETLLRGIAPLFDLPMSSFSRGDFVQENLIAKSWNIAPAICFEIAFANQMRANIFDGEQASDFILTVSNDAWFGDSHGPWQHLQIAQMRALEFAKPVIRVTNNGVTAIVDERGKITQILPQFEEAVLTSELNITNSQTFYHQFGNLPLYLLLLLLLAVKFWTKTRSKK